MHTRLLPAASALLLLLPAAAGAQVPLAPRALGAGGAYVAMARGHESVFANPANLGLPGSPAWSVGFPQVAAAGATRGLRVADLRDLVLGDPVAEGQREAILAGIPSEGASLDYALRAPLVTLQMGGFGMGVAYGWTGTQTASRDLVELLLDGYEEGRLDYRVGDTGGTSARYWDVALSYGRTLGPVSVGATGHYLRGQTRSVTRAYEPRYNARDRTLEVDYLGVSSEGGSGFALDLGAALQPAPGVTVSAAVTGLGSRLDWSDALVARSVTLTEADFGDFEPDRIQARWNRSEQPVASAPEPRFSELATGLADDARFATRLHLGAAWAAPTGTTVGVGAETSLRDGSLSGRWEQLLGVALEQRLPLVTARIGYAGDWAGSHMLSGGVSLGPVDLAAARLTGDGGDGWVASFGLSARTRAR